jgi:hypothetical protein
MPGLYFMKTIQATKMSRKMTASSSVSAVVTIPPKSSPENGHFFILLRRYGNFRMKTRKTLPDGRLASILL